jgi:leucyl-tRNA synthetase
MAGELWSILGESASICEEAWPEANKELLRSAEREIPVRINDRICQRIKVAPGLDPEKLESQALGDNEVQATLAGRPIEKVIAVTDRVVSIVLQPEPGPGQGETP